MSNSSGGFQDFCGDAFWDADVTWNTEQPRFTRCFQLSALVWVPAAWLWLTLPFYSCYLSSAAGHNTRIRSNTFNGAKTVVALALALVSLLDLGKGAHEYMTDPDTPLILIVSPVVFIATFLLSAVLCQVERARGLITSGIQFLFYTALLLCGVIPFYDKILDQQEQAQIVDVFRFVTFYVYYALVIAMFLMFCFTDTLPERALRNNKKPCPEIEASFLSRITFSWITSLVYAGFRKPLEDDDLWDLNPRDLTCNTYPRFEVAWNKQLAKSGHKLVSQASRASVEGGEHITSERSPLLGSGEKNSYGQMTSQESSTPDGGGGKKGSPSMFVALAKVYGLTLLQAHLCKFVCDLLTFVGPTLQKLLIGYTDDPSIQEWKGYLYAALFFVSSVINSFFFHQLFHIGMTLGMNIKSAVIAAVYKKALTMSNDARKTSTVGEIVNLMSVDAQRLQDVTGYLWMIWSAPLQIVLAVYLLWGILGPSVLAGLAVMILLIPVNGVMATLQRKLQIAQMSQKDQRIKLMNEVLNGIKVLKLYAWEFSFKNKVNVIRDMELDTLKKYAYLSAVGTFTWTCAPFLVTLASFATFVLSGGVLDAEKAFVSLSLFNILRFPINLLPMMISYIVTASVSIKRLSAFLQNGDLDFGAVQHDPNSTNPISVKGGTFSWGRDKDDLTVLKNVSLEVKDGELLAVVGQVGAGKSSLISAILGEMEKLAGYVNLRGSVALVAQQAWIQNATLRDNILFGKDYDAEKYDRVLEACALKPDLEILPGGDRTEIGEKGINLSGGQKQRVSLARAVYNDADIYLLDDPLSAVDSHVGKHIFEQVIADTGMLKGKTRLLVTHGLHRLPDVDTIAVMVGGVVSEYGTYDELFDRNGDFAQLLKQYIVVGPSDDDDDDSDEVSERKRAVLQRLKSIEPSEDLADAAAKLFPSGSDTSSLRRRKTSKTGSAADVSERRSRKMSRQAIAADIESQVNKKEAEKLIKDESSEMGQVKWSVFFNYCRALGTVNAILWMFFFLIFQAASVGSNIWLSVWTADPTLQNASIVNTTIYAQSRDLYLGVYGGLGALQALFVLLYSIVTAISMVRASGILHEGMLHNVLRAPMEFFDTTPIGRILNRFSRDIETIDNLLPNLIRSWLNTFFSVVSTIVVITYSTPIFLSVVVPLAIFYYFIQRFYIPTSRQLKRVESTSRSPIYVHFSETVTGASTIRAYAAQERFVHQSEDKVDHNLIFYFASIASNRWLGFRLELVGALIVFAAAIFAVIGRDSGINSAIVGLSISYALQVTQSLNWMVRMTSDLESNVVSVERVKEYSETPREAKWDKRSTRPPSNWPKDGNVVLENYSTRYRANLDLVIKGVSFNIRAGEKVGIVGRTGAGKSSLTLSLFRIIEAVEGKVIIDGLDIAELGLFQLRSKITILPQDPVLFSGTLRMNLDPLEGFSDEELYNVLKLAHLKDFVDSLPQGLFYECGEGGVSLSVGQRQLVCLARTLLHKTKILVLDEATAAVDYETDELIQKTIKREFANCTTITIAHRLNTIMSADRVMVMDAGKIVEFDNPTTLLNDPSSLFHSMAKDAGIRPGQESKA